MVLSVIQDMQGSKVLSDEAAAMYERAIMGLMKHSMLLYFAYADFEEVNCSYICDHCQLFRHLYSAYLWSLFSSLFREEWSFRRQKKYMKNI